mmetsp:Transcript_150237/g.482801  ORF Transcript_150237/g.482801 Transcript_150237/m.482801 type:complete len:366 (+) Transcript_150237:135-1232(+)
MPPLPRYRRRQWPSPRGDMRAWSGSLVLQGLLLLVWAHTLAFGDEPRGDGRISCFARAHAFSFCCSLESGPQGNELCWQRTNFSFDLCCSLAPWNDNERLIPYLTEPWLPVVLASPRHRFHRPWLQIHQDPQDRVEGQQLRSVGSGFLWRGGYQLFRWFECNADLQGGDWSGKRYIEFGAGVGAAGLVAALNGARVTMIDADADRGLLARNVQANLPVDLQSNVRICQLNWSLPVATSLQRLADCEGLPVAPKYDLLASSAGALCANDRLVALLAALAHRDAWLLTAWFVTGEEYVEVLDPLFRVAFDRVAILRDGGITAFEKDLPLMVFRPRGSVKASEKRSPRSLIESQACINRPGIATDPIG